MTPTCKSAERWISIQIDGERLEPHEARNLAEHLSLCGRCARVLEREIAQAGTISRALHVDDSVLETITRQVREAGRTLSVGGDRSLSPSFRTWRWSLAAAAALVVGLSIWWSLSGPPPQGSGGVVGSGLATTQDTPSRGSLPYKLIYTGESWDVPYVFTESGPPRGRGVRGTQWYILDSAAEPGGDSPGGTAAPRGGSAQKPFRIIGLEQLHRGDVQFTGWSYR